ncbi:MAG: hypothetical protein M1832_005881 [Thelocarpon impressellum]|nr:MAG: hypothetical protein M1832_005881 [Thelocarpon impressellum]
MGCCLSTARPSDQPRASPYASAAAHAGSSSRGLHRGPAAPPRHSDVESAGATPAAETQAQDQHQQQQQQQRRRRRRQLDEHYNKPLRRHVWVAERQWTPAELQREREAYFDTRVTGRAETWHAIRMAIDTMDADLGTAQTILDAAGVTVPTGDLINGVYDDVGNYYALPEPCVSDPVNISHSPSTPPSKADRPAPPPDADADADSDSDGDSDGAARRREEKGKTVIPLSEMQWVRARLSDRGGPDVQVQLGRGQTVRVLARQVQEEAGIPGRDKIRVAYMGKMLKEGESLAAQGWVEGHVVNALVFP